MDEKYFQALISNSFEDLKQLFSKTPPDPKTLHKLISRLAQHSALPSLQLLLILINETLDATQHKTAIVLIHHKLLINALSRFDQPEITLQIKQLNQLLDHDSMCWQDIINDLSEWIKQSCQTDNLPPLLQDLSLATREKLYEHLLEMLDDKPLWLNPLINYVIQERPGLGYADPLRSHIAKLANLLLLAPLTCDTETIKRLALRLPIEKLAATTFKLRAIGSAYSSANIDEKKKKTTRNHQLRQTYLHNFNLLADTLMIRATTPPCDYQQLANSDKELANLLMTRRLQSLNKRLQAFHNLTEQQELAKSHKELIIELLNHGAQFNWRDAQFNAEAVDNIIKVLGDMKGNELYNHLKLYYQYCQTSSRDIVRFLDRLYGELRLKNTTTQPIDQIIGCLSAIDALHPIEINGIQMPTYTNTTDYITHSQIRDHRIYGCCLEKLDLQQLFNLCRHMLVLNQIRQTEDTSILTTYCQVLCKKMASDPNVDHNIDLLHHEIKQLHTEYQQDLEQNLITNKQQPSQQKIIIDNLHEFIPALFNELNQSAPSLRFKLLVKLLPKELGEGEKQEISCDTKLLLPHCRLLIKTFSTAKQISQIIDFLNHFGREVLFNYYLYLLNEQADNNEFDCFITLFKDASREPLLIYILTNTPLIKQSFIDKLLPVIESKNLLTLINKLVKVANTNPAYTNTLNQLLSYLCAQLQLNFNSNDPIHQWVSCENHQLIASALLMNPVCFESLTTRSTRMQRVTPNMLQGIVTTSASRDLELRAIRLLEYVPSSSQEAKQAALALLSHFRQQPAYLHNLFNNLESVKKQLSAQGLKHYTELKQACWSLLSKPEAGDYNDERAVELLTSQLTSPHRFDMVLAELIKNLLNSHSNLSALYLSQIDTSNLGNIPQFTLVTILCNSMDKATENNWKTIAQHLNTESLDKQTAFVNALIERVSNCDNNPLLTQRIWQFIISLNSFYSLLPPQLTDLSLQWIIKQSPPDFFTQEFLTWFKALLAQGNQFDCGSLLALLPANIGLLQQVFSVDGLSNYYVNLVVKLITQESCTLHLVTLFQRIEGCDIALKKTMIDSIHQQLPPAKLTATGASFLNMLVLNLAHSLQFHEQADKRIVLQQLELFMAWAKALSTSAPHYLGYVNELRQLVFNMLSVLSELDLRWIAFIMDSEVFAGLTFLLLPSLESKDFDRDLFTDLLKKHITTVKLHPNLLKDEVFQAYIKQVLMHPPKNLTEEQFALLFDKLDVEAQIAFALVMLRQPSLDDVQWSALLTVSSVLLEKTLFRIYRQSKTKFIFVDLLARHPQGITHLTIEQQSELLKNLDSGKQLLRILDSQTPVRVKFDFVRAIFSYLQYSNKSLAAWIEELHIDGRTLAIMANYTPEPHQASLQQFIDNTFGREFSLRDYLKAEPTMHVEPQGLLYQQLSTALLRPERGWQCHPKTLKMLDPKTQFNVLRRQQRLLTAVQQLGSFYKPMIANEQAAHHLLTAGRWLQRLPLLDALMQIVISHADTKQTELDQLIQLMLQPNQASAAIGMQMNDLFRLLNQYISTLSKEELSARHPYLMNTMRDYDLQLSAIAQVGIPQLLDLFRPDSYFGRVKQGNTELLRITESNHLSTAHAQYQQKLKQTYRPQDYLRELITSISDDKEFWANPKVQSWLFNDCLFSSLTEHCEPELFAKFLAKVNLENLDHLNQRIKAFQTSLDDLQTFKSATTVADLLERFNSLSSTTLASVQEACDFVQLPYLSRLLLLRLQLNKAKLPASAILLPRSFSNGLEMEWLNNEFRQLQQRRLLLSKRLLEIKVASLKYHDDEHNCQRLNHIAAHFNQTESEGLATCLNSYLLAFSPKQQLKTCSGFMQLMTQLLTQQGEHQHFIAQLNIELIEQMLLFARENPVQYEPLLQQLIIHGAKNACFHALTNYLREQLAIYIKSDPSPQHLDDLTIKQLAQLPPEIFAKLIIIQRLIAMIKPSYGLQDWQLKSDIGGRGRIFFCANASLLGLLNRFNRQLLACRNDNESLVIAQSNLQHGFALLRQEVEAKHWIWIEDELRINLSQQPPGVSFHYAQLFAFLKRDPLLLVNHFISWLSRTDSKTLPKDAELQALLQSIVDQQFLAQLCQQLRQQSDLDPNKASWLFDQIKTHYPDQLATIIGALSWVWLANQIKSAKANSLSVLQAALQQEHHIAAITRDLSSMIHFINLLKECNFTVDNLIQLLQHLDCAPLGSLLALHLLSRNDYFNQLKQGQALLPQISNNCTYRLKRRAQALIERVDWHHLTPELLDHIQPEAAASLLCSPRHFHHVEEALIRLLIQKAGNPSHLINYWLRFYSGMPNYHRPLCLLLKLYSKDTVSAIKSLNEGQREQVLETLMGHYSQLDNAQQNSVNSLFVEFSQESYLLRALNLYLHDNKQLALIPLIKLLVSQLQSQQHAFQAKTMQALIRITENKQFADLRVQFSQATSNFLLNNALHGDCSIFYNSRRIAIKRIQKPIIFASPESSNQPKSENGLISLMRKHFEQIYSIDYFLIHYRGQEQHLGHFLHDYYQYFSSQSYLLRENKPLHVTSWLVTREEVTLSTRQVIFDSFLTHRHVVDGRIAAHLLRYNTTASLRSFARDGYSTLINFCVDASPHLADYPQVNESVQRARNEARFELALSTLPPFLKSLRVWFKRCWFYGWTGFLKPKKPVYVASFENQNYNQSPQSQIANLAPQRNLLSPVPQLENLLNTNANDPIDNLTALHDALERYDLEPKTEQELDYRQKIETLFNQLLLRRNLDTWLAEHYKPFLRNREKLIALYCLQDNNKALRELFSTINDGIYSCKAIKEELFASDNLVAVIPKSAPTPTTEPEKKAGIFGTLKGYLVSRSLASEAGAPGVPTNSLM